MDEELRGTTEKDGGFEMSVEETVTDSVDKLTSDEANVEMNAEEPMAYYEPVVETQETCEQGGVVLEKELTENDASNISDTMSDGRKEVWRHEPDSPYSPLYVPDKKQASKSRLTIGIIIALLLVLVACLVFLISQLISTAIEEASLGMESWKEAYQDFMENLEEEDDFDDSFGDWGPVPDEDKWPDEFNWEDYEEYNEYDEYDTPGDDTEYEEYIPDADDEYYVEIVDSIRDDLSYSVNKEEYTYYDENSGVSVYVEYAVLEGENVPFIEEINAELEESAMFYASEFASEDITDFTLFVESHVTYMDEEILSVVIDEQCYWGYEGTVDLYCLNFDMQTGLILQNTEMIEVSEELAEEFREMSDYQNGSIEHLEELSDKEIEQYLSDEDYLILFYTPVGLEIGMNYFDGWVTATIKEYEKYMRKL